MHHWGREVSIDRDGDIFQLTLKNVVNGQLVMISIPAYGIYENSDEEIAYDDLVRLGHVLSRTLTELEPPRGMTY